MAERGGGRRSAGGALGARADAHLEAAAFAWSVGGSPAVGGYEIFTA